MEHDGNEIDINPTLIAAKAAFVKGDAVGQIVWVKSTAQVADYFIGCVPPIYGPEGSRKVACGEASHTNKQGETVWLTFRYIGDAVEARYCTRAEIKSPTFGVPQPPITDADIDAAMDLRARQEAELDDALLHLGDAAMERSI
jgi:hypothetical protein